VLERRLADQQARLSAYLAAHVTPLAIGTLTYQLAQETSMEIVHIGATASFERAFAAIGKVDAVTSVASGAVFKPLAANCNADFVGSNRSTQGLDHSHQRRFGTGDTGRRRDQAGQPWAERRRPRPSLELKNDKIRVNVVSPPWISATLAALKMDPSNDLPAAEVGMAYLRRVEGP
jgi:hypothetical protein